MSFLFRFLKKFISGGKIDHSNDLKKISKTETQVSKIDNEHSEKQNLPMPIEKAKFNENRQSILKQETEKIYIQNSKIEEKKPKEGFEVAKKSKKKTDENDPYGHEFVSNFLTWQQNSRNGFSTPLGSRIIPIDGIDSTNDYISSFPYLPSGTIVVARRQNKGKGQRERKWISNLGGLYLSIKFVFHEEHSISHSKIFWIQTAIAISTCKAIEKLGLIPSLKWPNDIMVAGKKIGGILGESKIGNQGLVIVMGLGLNVENKLSEIITEFPELEGKISSVKEELLSAQKDGNLPTMINEIFKNMMLFLDAYWNSEFPVDILKKEWLKFTNLIDKPIKFRDLENESFNATVDGISEFGSLLVTTENGNKKELSVGEIELL